MSVASASTSSDSWDHTFPGPLPSSQRRTAPAQAIPNDWDDDDDDEEVEDQQKLWEDANQKAPMPELVISASSTTTVVSPPPAAFQPTLRILKRPTAAPAASIPSAAGSDAQKSYAERERQYQEARERIFKQESTSSRGVVSRNNDVSRDGGPASRDGDSSCQFSCGDVQGRSRSDIIREPRGPDTATESVKTTDARGSRGFTNRRGTGGTHRG
ncbi:hypothetical protein AcW1_002492 [Taiwanofungus camphoratus]|nr:hypothetical protein AcV7_005447 [Antrodia cinnamomea]KAI0943289.1 hypothetical protein AcW1_002492 [Antrodia cinnamomea]